MSMRFRLRFWASSIEKRNVTCNGFEAQVIKPSENSDAKRIKARRKARRTPARYAKQENSAQKCSTRRRCREPGNLATRVLVGHHERSQRIFRASLQGRPGNAALRSREAGKRAFGRSGWNCEADR